ncbi:DUF3800 domain-containing protein [Comamonas sp. MYb69]|uniref:DUF3800 domain-containing protein n=1 Tax=Comamonas sp. MYb69 TaxID=1848650 RepID=UPI0030B65B92
MAVFNLYCDESCHLENDGQLAMTLGSVWCSDESTREIARRVREIKKRHKMPPNFELKWNKVSPSKLQLYMDIVDYFFDDDSLHFRALVVPDKSKVHHNGLEGQDHDVWYYKMYFTLIKTLLSPTGKYNIYIDIKDTKGAKKISKLHEVLSYNQYDFSRRIVQKVQLVRSDEVEQMQIVDMLAGAVSYVNRNLSGSKAKEALISRIRERSGYRLNQSTLLQEKKFNIFCWRAQEVNGE